jgi:formate hydrogenlyase subunit 4
MDGIVFAVFQLCVALVLAPLLPGVVNRIKAVFAGRRGTPLLQTWYDIAKLLGKGAVYSRTTGWVFRAGPVMALAAAVTTLCLVPWAGGGALLSFDGDLVLFAGLLALMRFVTIVAALDTGSAFEGMGASREAWFSSLGEPALLLGLAAVARTRGSITLAGILGVNAAAPAGAGAVIFLVTCALFIVYLAENARIPVDDPNTHLELTMIHEVMVLDHGGVDLAYIQYGASLKLWVLGGLVVSLAVPHAGPWYLDAATGIAGIVVVAAATGVVESIMARLRLIRVPQLLVAALAMSALGLALALMTNPPSVALMTNPPAAVTNPPSVSG